MNRLRVGVVGCGGFARGNHIPNIEANPRMELAVLCDLDESILERLAAAYPKPNTTSDFERLCADASIDLIVCATKPSFRLPIMRRAAEAGKPLFVEKPMSYEIDETISMYRLMKDAPGMFMVGFNRPYSPIMQSARKMYREYRNDSVTIVYRIVGEGQLWPKSHWDAVMVRNESTVIHEVTHIFDLINWLVGAEPLSIHMSGEGNTDNVLSLVYPDRVTAVIVAGDNGTLGFPKERLEINTGYATIVADNFVELTGTNLRGARSVEQFPYIRDGEPISTSGAEAAEYLWEWRESLTDEQIDYGYYYDSRPKVDKGHAAELEFFRRAITGEGEPIRDARRGAVSTMIAWEAIESWRTRTERQIDYGMLDLPVKT